MKWTVLTIWVLSESCGDPSDSPAPATYRTLGFSLDAITNLQRKERRRSRRARITKKKQRHGCEGVREMGEKLQKMWRGGGMREERRKGRRVEFGRWKPGWEERWWGTGQQRQQQDLGRHAPAELYPGPTLEKTERWIIDQQRKARVFLAGGGCLSLFCWKFPTCINKVWLSQLINLPSSFHGRLSADSATDTMHTALLFLGSSLGFPVSER